MEISEAISNVNNPWALFSVLAVVIGFCMIKWMQLKDKQHKRENDVEQLKKIHDIELSAKHAEITNMKEDSKVMKKELYRHSPLKTKIKKAKDADN